MTKKKIKDKKLIHHNKKLQLPALLLLRQCSFLQACLAYNVAKKTIAINQQTPHSLKMATLLTNTAVRTFVYFPKYCFGKLKNVCWY